MRFGSVCSGIEAASVAWHPLGWEAAWFAEIEPFPSAVLAHRWPGVPNLGDMSRIAERVRAGEVEAPDLLAGGTPCQAFSVAGLRQSLDDARGNLTLTFARLADAIDERRKREGRDGCVVFCENVPGFLSTKDNAFGCLLGALAGESVALQSPGGKWPDAGAVYGPARTVAWRVLDAQYFGLAQRRRRVFVVASSREGFNPAAVLFEFDGARRDSAPSRETRQGTAGAAVGSLESRDAALGMWRDGGQVSQTIDAVLAKGQTMPEKNRFPAVLVPPVSVALRGRDGGAACEVGDDTAFTLRASSGGGDKPHVLAPARSVIPYDLFQVTAPVNRQNRDENSPCHTLARDNAAHAAAVFSVHENQRGGGVLSETAGAVGMQVRRLTPRECERLQGFPDDYTLIPWRKKPAEECPDGPRYKALGNSWAVPVVRWIGERIARQ